MIQPNASAPTNAEVAQRLHMCLVLYVAWALLPQICHYSILASLLKYFHFLSLVWSLFPCFYLKIHFGNNLQFRGLCEPNFFISPGKKKRLKIILLLGSCNDWLLILYYLILVMVVDSNMDFFFFLIQLKIRNMVLH